MERKRDNGQLQRYARIKMYLYDIFFFCIFPFEIELEKEGYCCSLKKKNSSL